MKQFRLPALGGLGLSEMQQRLLRVFVFLVKLIALSVPLYVIISLPGVLMPMQYAVTGNTFWMLSAAGYPVTQEGVALTVETGEPITFLITEDCTGWKSMVFFFALVFAVAGVAVKRRLLALAVGIPIIWLGNLARIFIIVGVQQSYGMEAALLVHDVFWQIGLVALVLVLWFVWLFKFSDYGIGSPGKDINKRTKD